MGRLKVISDHLEGSFDLPEQPWRIGRGNDCDIQLVHKSVSRHHCIITETSGELRVEDLGSTYGTFINGAQVTDAHAVIGDKLKLGRIVLVYEAVAKASHSAPAPLAPSPPSHPVAPVQAPAPAAPAKPKFITQPQSPPPARPEPAPAPKLPAAGPKAVFRDSMEAGEDVPGPKPVPKKPATAGVYNRLAGGHQRKSKAEKPDYEKESKNWEKRAASMEQGDGSPDYAAEAEDWENVWGKEKKRKGFTFFGGGPSGAGFMSLFGGLPAKLRAVVLVAILAGVGGGGKVAYDRATAHILVPTNVAKTKSLRPTPDNKDAILEKAVETFGKTIPAELRD